MSLNIIVIMLLLCMDISSSVLADRAVPSELFNIDHLREVILTRDGSDRTDRSSVIVMYDGSCPEVVQDLRQKIDALISPVDLIVMFHNEEMVLKNTWYKVPDAAKLTAYFPVEQCPTVYFMKEGYLVTPMIIDRGDTCTSGAVDQTCDSMDTEQDLIVKWDGVEPITDWIWNNMKVEVTLVNMKPHGIIFLFHGQKVAKRAEFLPQGSEVVVSAYISNFVTSVSAAGEFFYGWTLHSNVGRSYRFVVADFFQPYVSQSENDWLADAGRTYQKHTTRVHERRMCDVNRHLLNLKQPLLVKNYTEQGFKKMQMPDGLHTVVRSYYMEHREDRSLETWEGVDTNINQYDQRSLMVVLPSHIQDMIYRALGPVLEQWCSCSLEGQALYGIREYYHGHVLHNHVDRVTTHAISAILQIEQDLDNQRDWELELVDYHGDRKVLSLHPGEMLLYESSKLIHGRPMTLQGRMYANIFVHYRPTSNWTYDSIPGESLTNGNLSVNLWPLEDNFTKTATIF